MDIAENVDWRDELKQHRLLLEDAARRCNKLQDLQFGQNVLHAFRSILLEGTIFAVMVEVNQPLDHIV